MKTIFYTVVAGLLMLSCNKENDPLGAPSTISNVRVEPRVGAAVVKWTLPKDSNFLYVELSYLKKGKVIKTQVSKHIDSIVITGLLNKLDYTFELQVFNRNRDAELGGPKIVTNSVKPIKRPVATAYLKDQLTKVEGITNDMVETFTQQSDEGPKQNLFDGNINTYWHSAWSGNVQALPHWIRINFPTATTIGAFKYFVRQSSHVTVRPNQFAIETSEDGLTWKRQWTSQTNLPVDPMTVERQQDFGKNLTSKYFRLMLLANQGNFNYTHLAELSFFNMKEQLTDLEKQAEDNY